jgi:hypothetical protein
LLDVGQWHTALDALVPWQRSAQEITIDFSL